MRAVLGARRPELCLKICDWEARLHRGSYRVFVFAFLDRCSLCPNFFFGVDVRSIFRGVPPLGQLFEARRCRWTAQVAQILFFVDFRRFLVSILGAMRDHFGDLFVCYFCMCVSDSFPGPFFVDFS